MEKQRRNINGIVSQEVFNRAVVFEEWESWEPPQHQHGGGGRKTNASSQTVNGGRKLWSPIQFSELGHFHSERHTDRPDLGSHPPFFRKCVACYWREHARPRRNETNIILKETLRYVVHLQICTLWGGGDNITISLVQCMHNRLLFSLCIWLELDSLQSAPNLHDSMWGILGLENTTSPHPSLSPAPPPLFHSAIERYHIPTDGKGGRGGGIVKILPLRYKRVSTGNRGK